MRKRSCVHARSRRVRASASTRWPGPAGSRIAAWQAPWAPSHHCAPAGAALRAPQHGSSGAGTAGSLPAGRGAAAAELHRGLHFVTAAEMAEQCTRCKRGDAGGGAQLECRRGEDAQFWTQRPPNCVAPRCLRTTAAIHSSKRAQLARACTHTLRARPPPRARSAAARRGGGRCAPRRTLPDPQPPAGHHQDALKKLPAA